MRFYPIIFDLVTATSEAFTIHDSTAYSQKSVSCVISHCVTTVYH